MAKDGIFSFLKTAAAIALTVGLVWLGGKYILPCILPIVLAFLTAWAIEPMVQFLQRHFKIRRGFASVMSNFLALAAVLGLLGLGLWRLGVTAARLGQQLPEMFSSLPDTLASLRDRIYGLLGRVPEEIRGYLEEGLDSLSGTVSQLPALLGTKALSLLTGVIAALPKIALFCLTYAISVFFIGAGFPQVKAFLLRQVPAPWQAKLRGVKEDVLVTLGRWLRAEAALSAITFGILLAAFFLLRRPNPFLLALVTAVVDALPVLGSGTVLVPWALGAFLTGNTTLGIGLLITYALSAVTRSIMEPKLMGSQAGLHPAAALLAMYMGFRFFGVGGMILFPLLLMLLRQLNSHGYIRLWK